ncbi:MAG: outer membrane beta-barrel protein, partial [Saprospiraceae bacterium]
MQKVSVLLIVLLYFITTNCTSLFAQTSIKGKVIDLQDAPISFANVLLLQAADSSLIKGEVTSELGTYEIETTQIGSFIISTTMIGFGVIYSQPFDIQSVGEQIQMDVIRLAEESITLTGVDVVAKKPLYEQQIDRLVVNVQNSITSSGATALEVLERSPGVAVNRQNSALSMAGKQGVVVMINGKINRTPVAAVVQLLEGMSADNIEKIELITTPPANYEAEGDAGFINIILKKTSDRGLNGAFTLSAGVGNGNTSAASTNFNFRKNKFNLFGDYSYSRKEQKQLFKNYRKIVLDENTVENSTVSARDPIQLNHNARLGLDYQLSEKTVAGVLISAYNNKWSMNAVNTVDVLVNQSLDTLITLDNIELNQWKHWGGNFNLQHNFTDASQLNFDVDYLRYDNENPTDYFNTYRDATGNILFEQVTRSGKSTPVTIAVGKLDYSKKINDKFKIESGLKGTVSRFENDVNVAELVSDVWVNDPNFTAIFNLEEDITAAYVSLDAQLNAKTSGKLGLRYEHTRSNLGSATMPNIVDRNYGNFFPTVFVSRTLSDDSNLNFSYSRRITRPTFNDMAPFVIFIDPNTFYSGNAALQPALSNTVKVDYRLKTVMMSVSYSKDDDAIARFQPRLDPETNQTVIGSANLNFRETFA